MIKKKFFIIEKNFSSKVKTKNAFNKELNKKEELLDKTQKQFEDTKIKMEKIQSEIKNLINIWEDQTGRPPTNKEIDMIIKNLVNEEILYQEALKLGLNKNDKIIKRRLIQKLEFYKESENLNKVKEENIIEYYNENINSYKLNK